MRAAIWGHIKGLSSPVSYLRQCLTTDVEKCRTQKGSHHWKSSVSKAKISFYLEHFLIRSPESACQSYVGKTLSVGFHIDYGQATTIQL